MQGRDDASHLIPRGGGGGPGFFRTRKNFEFYKKKLKNSGMKRKTNLHNHLKKLYYMSKFTHFLSILLAQLVILYKKKSAAHAVSRD